MIDHGGLDINHGRKTILGPEPASQRKKEQLDESLETAHERVDQKEEAVRANRPRWPSPRPRGMQTSGTAPG